VLVLAPPSKIAVERLRAALPANEWRGPLPSSNFDNTFRAVLGTVNHSMVGTIASAEARFKNPTSNVSAHFGIGLSGRIVMWVRVWHIAYHAGNWPINVERVGIEHEDEGRHWDSERTPEMYLASAALHRALASEYGFDLTLENCGPHRWYNATACPSGLDIERILAIAKGEAGMVDLDKFNKYVEQVGWSFDAVKELLNPLAKWAAGAPGLPAGKVKRLTRLIELSARPPKGLILSAPKRTARSRPRGAPSDSAVRSGHGRG
jgi:hypothetical protein